MFIRRRTQHKRRTGPYESNSTQCRRENSGAATDGGRSPGGWDFNIYGGGGPPFAFDFLCFLFGGSLFFFVVPSCKLSPFEGGSPRVGVGNQSFFGAGTGPYNP